MLEKIEGKWTRGRQRIRWLDSITDSTDMHLSKLWGIVEEPVYEVAKSWTRLSNNPIPYFYSLLVSLTYPKLFNLIRAQHFVKKYGFW